MTSVQILQKTRELLTTKGWTKGAAARDADGGSIQSSHPQAATFCLVGALSRAFKELDGDWESSADFEPYANTCTQINTCVRERALITPSGYHILSMPGFNDYADTTLTDVLAVIDCGIAKLAATDGTIESDGN